MEAEGASGRATYLDEDTVLMEVLGADLVLLPCHSIVGRQWHGDRALDLIDYRGFCTQQLRAGEGTRLRAEVSQTVEGDVGPFDDQPLRHTFSAEGGRAVRAALRISGGGKAWRDALPAFDGVAAGLGREWEDWLGKRPPVAPGYEACADAAWHLLWSNTAAPSGLYRREPMLVGNYYFNRIYTWDNCFHALGVVEADPELATAQLQVLYDHQAEGGAIPDPLSDQRAHFAFTKPPVHGWAVLEMIRATGGESLRPWLPDLYAGMKRWTAWWFDCRDGNGSGFPKYLRGQDSGWDNATPFDVKVPIEGADLQAHLVLQMEALGRVAELLGMKEEASHWETASANHLTRFLQARWKGGRFSSPGVGGELQASGDSLLDRMPIELGPRLPPEVRNRLLEELRDGGRFLNEHGLATEALDSPLFNAKGYWRGPIWPPSTYLVFTGLRDLGETGLARTVAERFCALCARDNVFWENYHPLEGTGNDSPSLGWGAAVFLRLAQWLGREGS